MSLPTATVMGIVNVTPDSFSDGGRFVDVAAAVAHGRRLADEGATLLDVGGESTRPGADPVTAEAERARVLPVIEALAADGVRVSVDTMKADVADAALRAGAGFVNDVSALADPAMADVIAGHGAEVCLVHMQGHPQTMQQAPHYDNVVDDVCAFLSARIQTALDAGIAPERIVVDPGIGFGKTIDHNLTLLDALDAIVALGFPVLVGVSRKSFLGHITGRGADERVAATVASNVLAYARGARIFRVHDVAPTVDGLRVAAATLARTWTPTTT